MVRPKHLCFVELLVHSKLLFCHLSSHYSRYLTFINVTKVLKHSQCLSFCCYTMVVTRRDINGHLKSAIMVICSMHTQWVTSSSSDSSYDHLFNSRWSNVFLSRCGWLTTTLIDGRVQSRWLPFRVSDERIFNQKSRMILFNGATKAPIARYYRVSLHQTAYHDCVSHN